MKAGMLLLIALIAACTAEPEVKKPAVDDGCVGYMIKPDGSKQCVHR